MAGTQCVDGGGDEAGRVEDSSPRRRTGRKGKRRSFGRQKFAGFLFLQFCGGEMSAEVEWNGTRLVAVSFDKGGTGSVLIGQAWQSEGFKFRAPQ